MGIRRVVTIRTNSGWEHVTLHAGGRVSVGDGSSFAVSDLLEAIGAARDEFRSTLCTIEKEVLDHLDSGSGYAMTVAEICAQTDEKDPVIRKVLKGLISLGLVRRLPSVYTGDGSSGARYQLESFTDAKDWISDGC